MKSLIRTSTKWAISRFYLFIALYFLATGQLLSATPCRSNTQHNSRAEYMPVSPEQTAFRFTEKPVYKKLSPGKKKLIKDENLNIYALLSALAALLFVIVALYTAWVLGYLLLGAAIFSMITGFIAARKGLKSHAPHRWMGIVAMSIIIAICVAFVAIEVAIWIYLLFFF